VPSEKKTLTDKEIRTAAKSAKRKQKKQLQAQQKAKVTNIREYDAWVAGKIANRLSQQNSSGGGSSSNGTSELELAGEQ
jgi:hypothetical protein